METKVQTPAEIIARMEQAVPPGRQVLKGEELRQLATLTHALLASKTAAQEEYSRFLAAAEKDIDLPYPVLAACLNGKRILLHRVQAGRRVAAVPGGCRWADRLLSSEVHPCHRQLDYPCPAAGLV